MDVEQEVCVEQQCNGIAPEATCAPPWTVADEVRSMQQTIERQDRHIKNLETELEHQRVYNKGYAEGLRAGMSR